MAIISMSATPWSRRATPPASPIEAAWTALERKGLLKSNFPMAATLTPEGLAYDTGLAGTLLHRGHH